MNRNERLPCTQGADHPDQIATLPPAHMGGLDLQGHTLEEIREHFEVTQARRREAKKVREAKAREATGNRNPH